MKIPSNLYMPGKWPDGKLIVPSSGVGIQYTAPGAESAIIKFKAPASSTIIFDFGDDFAPVSVPGNDAGEIIVNHGYAGAGTYTIKLTGDFETITSIDLNGEDGFDGNLDDFLLMPNLTYLDLSSTSMTGSTTDLITLTSMITLKLVTTAITGDIADIAPMTALTVLYINNSAIDTYTQGTLPDWDGCNINISDLGLSQQEVDDFVDDLNTVSSSSSKVLNISGSNAVGSFTGLTSMVSLDDKGWIVTPAVMAFSYTGSTIPNNKIYFKAPSGKSVTMHWRAGNSDVYAGDDANKVYMNHAFGGADTWQFILIGDLSSITEYSITGSYDFTGDVGQFKYLTGVDDLYLFQTYISGDPAPLSALRPNRVYGYLTKIEGNVSFMNLWSDNCSRLQFHALSSTNKISGDLKDYNFENKTDNSYIYLQGNKLTSYTASQTIPVKHVQNRFDDNNITAVADIDRLIHDYHTNLASRSVSGILYLNNGTNAIPSATGVTEAAAIATHGWTVTLNS